MKTNRVLITIEDGRVVHVASVEEIEYMVIDVTESDDDTTQRMVVNSQVEQLKKNIYYGVDSIGEDEFHSVREELVVDLLKTLDNHTD